MEFSDEKITGLKKFISLIKEQPQLLEVPELSFFKQYLCSLGASIPHSSENESHKESQQEDSELSEDDILIENPDIPLISPSENDVPIQIPEESSETDYEKIAELKHQAIEARDSGDLLKALELITEVINLNPNSTINIGIRGQILLELKRPLSALSDGEEAVKRNENSAKGYLIRGKAKMMLGQYIEAYKDIQQAQQIDFNEQEAAKAELLAKKVQYLQIIEGRKRRKEDLKAAKEKERKRKEEEDFRKSMMKVHHIHNEAEYQHFLSMSSSSSNAHPFSFSPSLVVVDFSATWCGPCQQIKPVFESLPAQHPRVLFLHVDVDENRQMEEVQSVSGVPTFRFWKDGKKVDEFSGADERKLRDLIEKYE
ncbi:Protein disulfide-isomerase [Monocercomonoides exilis]|uniref:Protein disulfide-isomerase n=1 Tax=Monocercomonoides exilis TaxID=2049356 RepID=UPI0035598C5A|nr:Protein disulfide-isomerase [Monocercomonoides exilis]|eukprot:MONOS_9857.1-p1 / transcript=MONOS_9857.1 / gene=MONOS_9857 / organism=Monocercomonoides_exilis_PA203 / gene_product=Protein disulfide-isomerase / transcript_product=Protein disulfide-isomerase / location=Mono_scaffold00423:11540-13185(-) / protein_length=369 / sequence_SO=supercontig / SO=protein_coding / is_pseudo=false